MKELETAQKFVEHPEAMLKGWLKGLLRRDDAGLEAALAEARGRFLAAQGEQRRASWERTLDAYAQQTRVEKAALTATLYGMSLVYDHLGQLVNGLERLDGLPQTKATYHKALAFARQIQAVQGQKGAAA